MNIKSWHQDNRTQWEARAEAWASRSEADGSWLAAAADPQAFLDAEELPWLGDLAGQDVAVLGSGDNLAVFALAAMGARVTSVDISAVQLRIAAARAATLGLDIRFERRDVTELQGFAEESYDLVYTGGHVAVWLADLPRCYREAGRILRPGGRLVVNEYHPFRRIWRWQAEELIQDYSYFDRGPHTEERDDLNVACCAGPLRSHEFHWTVSDYANAVIQAGLRLVTMREYGEGQEWWEQCPVGPLPLHLLLVGDK